MPRLLQRCGTKPWILLTLLIGINFVLFLNLERFSEWSQVARSHSRHVTSKDGSLQSTSKNPVVQTPEDGGHDLLQSGEPQGAEQSARELDKEFPSDESLRMVLAAMRQRIQDNADEHLFSALRGPGEKQLREAGVKGKIFQEALDVWEELNYFTINDSLYPRRDIASRLGALEGNSGIHTLDQFQHLLNRLGSRLFPWFFPSSGDLSALHTSYAGRGIVLTGGNPQVQHLRTLIQSIRKLGCKLPIELHYMGTDDMSERNRADFAKFENVILKDLSLVVDLAAWEVHGWAMKPYAMLASSFREVIFIDADVRFLVDPETLFTTEEYTSSGTLFFKDRTLLPEDKRPYMKAILPHVTGRFRKGNRFWKGSSSHMMESGVVVMDKFEHFVPLLMAARLNGPDRDGQGEGDDRVRGLYDYFLGDKETFWLGFEMIGDSDYRFHPVPAGALGKIKIEDTQAKSPDGRDEHIVCSAQILHFDTTGKPLWLNGGLKTSKIQDDATWAEFDVYLREPDEPEKSGLSHMWDVEDGNIMCLRNHAYSKFTRQEKETFAMLTELAKQSEKFVQESERIAREEERAKQ